MFNTTEGTVHTERALKVRVSDEAWRTGADSRVELRGAESVETAGVYVTRLRAAATYAALSL